MAACGVTGVELTEEQNSQIVEYAAGLLLKYDANYHGRLVQGADLEENQVEEEAPATEPEEPAVEDVNFNVTNVSGQDINLDMVSIDSKFRISINDASPKYALTTMLMNDLSSYIGTIPAGASENLVLVCEIPEEEAGGIGTIVLLMRNTAEEGQLTLN